MRILAIDLGDQRTGLARADRITNIASPAGLVEVPIDHDDGNRLLDALAPADIVVASARAYISAINRAEAHTNPRPPPA